MVSQTSGTTSFYLDVDDIIKHALDPLGGEYETAGEMKTARETLNLILLRLRNKNIPLSAIDVYTQPLTVGQETYVLPEVYTSILDVNLYIASSNTEINLTNYGLREFNNIPNKGQTGQPTVYSVLKGINNESINVWPLPNNASNSLKVLAVKKIEDISASYQRVALNQRYLPLLVDWLTYEMSLRRKGILQEIRMEFKAKYEETLSDAFDEDRERSDFNITIGGVNGR